MVYNIIAKKQKEKLVSEPVEYYEVKINRTSKPIGSKEPYSQSDNETKYFKTKEEADKFLKETYGKSKKQSMYIDKKDGTGGEKVGNIYGFKNKDWSHNSKSWYQQDWVEIRKIKSQAVV